MSSGVQPGMVMGIDRLGASNVRVYNDEFVHASTAMSNGQEIVNVTVLADPVNHTPERKFSMLMTARTPELAQTMIRVAAEKFKQMSDDEFTAFLTGQSNTAYELILDHQYDANGKATGDTRASFRNLDRTGKKYVPSGLGPLESGYIFDPTSLRKVHERARFEFDSHRPALDHAEILLTPSALPAADASVALDPV